MRNFQLIATGVDVLPLVAALKRHPELWMEDTYLRDYPQGPFGDMESIMLRFPVKQTFKSPRKLKLYAENRLGGYDQHENVDYPAYKLLHQARPLVSGLMARMEGERLGRVMINKLRPGGRITPHADTPLHAEYYSRFHICLQSGPGYVFYCGDEAITMNAGDVYWFNNRLSHSVINNAEVDRLSMVVDIRTPR